MEVRARAHVDFRPMRPEDVEAVDACATAAFEGLSERRGNERLWPEATAEDHRRNRSRFAHLVRQDPAGCWTAVAGEDVVGASVAILREDVWGLSLLVVDPAHQGVGIGATLLDRALAYGDGGRRGGIILSSDDPAAIRRYHRAGFRLRPAVLATGTVTADRLPGASGVRSGSAADLALCEQIGRQVRGASHGPDLRSLLENECDLLVAGERGFTLHFKGTPRILAAIDEDAARSLLVEAFARAPEGKPVFVPFLDERQAWAIDVAIACGLKVLPGGPVFTRGELGPMTPYIPSGAYL